MKDSQDISCLNKEKLLGLTITFVWEVGGGTWSLFSSNLVRNLAQKLKPNILRKPS